MAKVLEWAPFSLKAEGNEHEMIRASDKMQSEFLNRQAGFLRRELVKLEDGSYADLVLWESREAAEAVLAQAINSSACMTFFEHMRPEQAEVGAGVEHYICLRSYIAPNAGG